MPSVNESSANESGLSSSFSGNGSPPPILSTEDSAAGLEPGLPQFVHAEISSAMLSAERAVADAVQNTAAAVLVR